MKWDTISTPNSVNGKNDVLNPYFATVPTGSEVRDLAVGSDGKTLLAAVTVNGLYIGLGGVPTGALMVSSNGGISWSTTSDRSLRGAGLAGNHVYNVAIAPDDPKVWAVSAGTTVLGPTQFWVTTDSGVTWNNTNAPLPGALGEAIVSIDVSVDYGNVRDLMLVTRSGAGNGRFFILKSKAMSAWVQQVNPVVAPIDYFSAKFSPSYASDQSVTLVYADDNQTSYNIAQRDIQINAVLSYVFEASGIEVSTADNVSPSFAALAGADMSLPADFDGASASLRRTFISLYCTSPGATENVTGVFRMDNSVPVSMLPTQSAISQVNSISFSGTISTGKLMAGLVWGIPCTASVPTLFADTPCVCAGSCWYRPMKPTTGAANQCFLSDNISATGICENTTACMGVGSAVVDWKKDGTLAYVVTGSGRINNGLFWWNSGLSPWITTLIPNDESAFAISRNNGEVWNQLSLIDTTIDWFNDVAVSSDCTTLYLASVHRNRGIGCNEFDSVWRATLSPTVADPLPALTPVGAYWERVLTAPTSLSCMLPQTDLPILRTIQSCTERADGAIIAWAPQYTPLHVWSNDFGEHWSLITGRNLIQDFTFDGSKTIYDLSPLGLVQKLIFTGTGWSNNLPISDTGLGGAHTIAAKNGRLLVGAHWLANMVANAVSYSADAGQHWLVYRNRMPARGSVHVLFDTEFANNSLFYAAVDNLSGTIYRNTAPNYTRWDANNLMDVASGADGPDWWNDGYSQSAGDPPHQVGYYGIVQAFTGNPEPALYGAHENITTSLAAGPGAGVPSNSGVCRTLEPRNGIPKPGVYWDCLDVFAPAATTGVRFTLEPSSLKACGCCTLESNTTLFAIDNESGALGDNFTALLGKYLMSPGYWPDLNQGMLWAYTDCLAKKGPALKSPADGALVGADPVSGRNQQIDLAWEQLCLSTSYLLEVAKDRDFSLRINPAISNAANIQSVTGSILINMDEVNMTRPAAWLSPASLPEAGAVYFWRVCTYQSATRQIAVSPWSETRSFSVKPGFIVNTPYYGVQLLAPDNGCVSCKVKPASFSWSPWKEATRYEFVLAKDTGFTKVIKQATTSTTGYEYDGALDYSTNYFWRVRAIEVNGQPIPSEWSATFSFQTEPPPSTPLPAPPEPATPLWVWIVIAAGTLLVILTLVLIIKSSRRI
jgi:hypothetical protein